MQRASALWHYVQYVKVRTDAAARRMHNGRADAGRVALQTRMTMKTTPDVTRHERLEREVERERHERLLHDEERAGLAVDDEFRLKDARENMGLVKIRRARGR